MASTAGLVEPFKTHVEQLVAASHGAVSVSSGFRTYSQQLALRKKNGCPDVLHSPASACQTPTAPPGTSMHEKGKAVDFGGDLNLAAKLAPTFQMARTVTGEPWHYEPTNAASLPDATPVDGPGITGSIAGAGSNEGFVDHVLEGLAHLLIIALAVAGGALLVGAGAYRATTGRSALASLGRKAAGTVKTAGAAAALA